VTSNPEWGTGIYGIGFGIRSNRRAFELQAKSNEKPNRRQTQAQTEMANACPLARTCLWAKQKKKQKKEMETGFQGL